MCMYLATVLPSADSSFLWISLYSVVDICGCAWARQRHFFLRHRSTVVLPALHWRRTSTNLGRQKPRPRCQGFANPTTTEAILVHINRTWPHKLYEVSISIVYKDGSILPLVHGQKANVQQRNWLTAPRNQPVLPKFRRIVSIWQRATCRCVNTVTLQQSDMLQGSTIYYYRPAFTGPATWQIAMNFCGIHIWSHVRPTITNEQVRLSGTWARHTFHKSGFERPINLEASSTK